jgi:hypothetical protein
LWVGAYNPRPIWVGSWVGVFDPFMGCVKD